MAYCPNCGKELKPDDRFCSRCGSRAGVREDRGELEDREGREDRGEPEEGFAEISPVSAIEKRGNSGCAVIVILMIALLIYFTLSGKPEHSSGGTVPSPRASSEFVSNQESVPEKAVDPTISEGSVESEGTPAAGQASVSKPETEEGIQTPVGEDIPLKDWPELDVLPFSTDAFYMELPGTWAEHYSLEKWDNYYDFYNTENQDAGAGGFLFSIGSYEEYGLWEDLPSYEFLAEKDGVYYVAEFPTDVQFDAANEAIYYEMRADIDGILETFTLR